MENYQNIMFLEFTSAHLSTDLGFGGKGSVLKQISSINQIFLFGNVKLQIFTTQNIISGPVLCTIYFFSSEKAIKHPCFT